MFLLCAGAAPTILNRMVQYSQDAATAITALADHTRRGILEHLGYRDASISDLAGAFGMTLTGVKKHVSILEGAGLVTTRKEGRVRTCALGPRRLDEARAWIGMYHEMLESRLDRLGQFLEQTKESGQ
jgi:DNA-binding transcriptional ArsR family regulator